MDTHSETKDYIVLYSYSKCIHLCYASCEDCTGGTVIVTFKVKLKLRKVKVPDKILTAHWSCG